MSENSGNQTGQPVYRIDKFAVPEQARGEFLDRVAATHAVLQEQEGFVRDLILEQQSGPGEFNLVTFVEWKDANAIEKASAAVAKFHSETGFDRRAFITRLGIRADIANYRQLDM